MRKNVVIILLSVLAIALAGVALKQHRKIRGLCACQSSNPTCAQVAVRESFSEVAVAAPERSADIAAEERAQYEKRIDSLAAQLEATKEAEETATQLPPEDVATPGEQPDRPSMAGLADMLKNPGMKKMIRAQQKATMDITYGSLFKYLQLEPDQLEAFKELLLERQMALMDIGLGQMGTSMSVEERKALGERAVTVTEEYNEKILAFLGEEDNAVYKQYEDTQNERMQVNLFKQTLGSDQQLTDEQEHNLILAMREERKNFPFSTNYEKQEEFDPSQFSAEAVATHMKELAALQKKCASRAKEILAEGQMKQFESSLEQQRAMQEMGMKMAAQMFAAPAE